MKSNCTVRPHLHVWLSIWLSLRTGLSWKVVSFLRKLVSFLRKLLFIWGRSLWEDRSHSTLCLFFFSLRYCSLWKSQPFLKKYMKYSLKFSSQIKISLYCWFDYMAISLLYSDKYWTELELNGNSEREGRGHKGKADKKKRGRRGTLI